MRVTGVILMMLQCLAGPLWGDEIDWDAWVEGQVSVSLQVQGGEGALVSRASDGVLEFEATQSAYHMVVAIDTQGEMHLLFPRYWEDDGWVRRGSVQRLVPGDFATAGRPWSGRGVVHVEVVASPTPFDWERLGLRHGGTGCRWLASGRPWCMHDDPYAAFNRLHRRLFPRWDQALFVVDDTWFFVGERCNEPSWILARRPVRRAPAHSSSVQVQVRWEWDFGTWCARPVYRTPPRQRRPVAPVHRRQVVSHTPQRRVVKVPLAVDPRISRKLVVSPVERERTTRRDAPVPVRVRNGQAKEDGRHRTR